MNWNYTVNQTNISEEEAQKIYLAYQEYRDAHIIDDILQLNDTQLAHKIVKFYNTDNRYSVDMDEVRDAVDEYIDSRLSLYIFDHKAELNIDNEDLSNMEKGYIWSIVKKNPSLNYEGDVPLCEELEPLRQLHIKWVNAVHRWNEGDED